MGRLDVSGRAPCVAAVAMVYRNVAMSNEEAEDSRPNANAEVARLLAELGDILEIKGEPPYRYNAYRTAARSVANATERVDALFEQGRLRELSGIGNALEAKIVEYLATGRMEAYERERRDFPVALASLLQIPGLGPGRARSLYRELGVSTVTELEEAARSGRLQDVPGFGPKAVESLLVSLERLKQISVTRGLISDAWVAFEQVREALGQRGDADRLAVVGSVGKRNTGTSVHFWPDPKYFDSPKFSVSRLKHVLKAKAVLCPGLLVTFEGIDDRNGAEPLVGAYCTVPLAEARTLPADHYYHFQLVGLRVVDARHARELGQVAEVLSYPANDVLRVTGREREILIPMVRNVVRSIAPAEGMITVDLPEETST